MKLSIIIPARNEARMLPDTLHDVDLFRRALDVSAIENEVVVVDNDSTDETVPVAISAGAIVAQEPKHTPAAARNRGAASTWEEADWLLFMDADTSPTPQLAMEMINAMRTNQFDAGTALVKKKNFNAFGADLWNRIAVQRKQLSDSFLFIRASVFREIGGFMSDAGSGADTDLTDRIPASRRVVLTANPVELRPRV
jgi:glycosyltransferase involved in cell wall biosynthesis